MSTKAEKERKFKIVYTAEQFKEKGFDGEIASYMRANRNSAIYEFEDGRGVVDCLTTSKSEIKNERLWLHKHQH